METEQFMCEVFDNVLGSIIIFNDEGQVTFINQTGKQELGVFSGSYRINDFFSLLIPDSQINIPNFINTIENTEIVTSVYRCNNTCFPAKVRISRINMSELMHFNIASVINVTDEQYMEKEMNSAIEHMKQVMEVRNEFVANITHELRTPVNGIKGHIKNLQIKEEDIAKRRIMDIILKCCSNMEKIINDMLDFSKIEAGKFELNCQQFSFRECLEHVIEMNLPVANEKGIGLSMSIAEDIPDTMIGDDLRLVQILNNLISNGMKFTSIGSVRVEVYRTFQKNDLVELTFFVIDTGIGIGPEEKDRLFKSFSQVDGSVTRKYGGTGLGLYVTRQLVELMKGTITVSSEKGQGSTFSFTVCLNTPETGSDKQKIINVASALKHDEQNKETVESSFIYGTEENIKQTRNMLEKILLSVEMDNWEKAEYFSDVLKHLLDGADEDKKKTVFRMQMAVRKEDYDKSIRFIKSLMDFE